MADHNNASAPVHGTSGDMTGVTGPPDVTAGAQTTQIGPPRPHTNSIESNKSGRLPSLPGLQSLGSKGPKVLFRNYTPRYYSS